MQGEYSVFIFDRNDEIFTAMLSQLPFESFEEDEDQLKAYVADADVNADFDLELKNLCEQFEVKFTKEALPNINWNKEWESQFQPVEVNQFVRVKAVFHEDKAGFDHTIVIDPKMSFGTGHHETTYMMMEAMADVDFEGKSVLDYGSGTGILAILAQKLNASEVLGVDIEDWAYHNAIENKTLNNVDAVVFKLGDLSVVSVKEYDVILANITKNILVSTSEELIKYAKKGTVLLLSGVLEDQADEVIKVYESLGFTLQTKKQKGKWMCLKLNL
jgi:ribosomal protein L11 methyltransferase